MKHLSPLMKLSGVSLIITWTGLGGMAFLRYSQRKKIRTSEYYRTTMRLLHAFEPAKRALGEPIVDLPLDIFSPGVAITPFTARLTIPLSGGQNQGKLYSWSSRDDIGKGWRIERVDLEVKNAPERIPVYRDNSKFPRAQMVDPRLQNKPDSSEFYNLTFVDTKGNLKKPPENEDDCG